MSSSAAVFVQPSCHEDLVPDGVEGMMPGAHPCLLFPPNSCQHFNLSPRSYRAPDLGRCVDK